MRARLALPGADLLKDAIAHLTRVTRQVQILPVRDVKEDAQRERWTVGHLGRFLITDPLGFHVWVNATGSASPPTHQPALD